MRLAAQTERSKRSSDLSIITAAVATFFNLVLLATVILLARREIPLIEDDIYGDLCFPGAKVSAVLEEDYETEGLRYIVINAQEAQLSPEGAVAASDRYHCGLLARVPALLTGHFRLGLELAR